MTADLEQHQKVGSEEIVPITKDLLGVLADRGIPLTIDLKLAVFDLVFKTVYTRPGVGKTGGG